MSWCEDQRMAWIEETVRIFGYINREHIMKKFGVSTPQASVDLNRFMRRYPGRIVYDQHAKRYVPARTKI